MDSNSKYKGFPGCEYQCSTCGYTKFIITNTYQPSIFEKCTDECSWNNSGERGGMVPGVGGQKTGFHKRRYLIKDGVAL